MLPKDIEPACGIESQVTADPGYGSDHSLAVDAADAIACRFREKDVSGAVDGKIPRLRELREESWSSVSCGSLLAGAGKRDDLAPFGSGACGHERFVVVTQKQCQRERHRDREEAAYDPNEPRTLAS